MASYCTLTDYKIENLSREIGSKYMATIAIKDLGLSYETVENFKIIRQNDYIGFNRDLLILWRNKNPEIDQVQVRKPFAIYDTHVYVVKSV